MNENKRYNPDMPSEGYDQADYEALKASNIIPTLATVKGMHFDSAEDASIFFARELDYVKSKSYDKIYPEFTALNHFPITHEVPEGAETMTYYSYEKTGFAAIISNYATDLPRADVKGEPTTASVKSIGDSYGYSIQEMRASRHAGKSLDTRKADAARYAIDRTANTIAFAGDKSISSWVCCPPTITSLCTRSLPWKWTGYSIRSSSTRAHSRFWMTFKRHVRLYGEDYPGRRESGYSDAALRCLHRHFHQADSEYRIYGEEIPAGERAVFEGHHSRSGNVR